MLMFFDTFRDIEDWSEEEVDLISQWFAELESSPVLVHKIAARFKDKGIHRSNLEVGCLILS